MSKQERVIVVGEGAREHAVGFRLSQSLNKPQLFFTPGNAGTAQIGRNLDIGSTDIEKIVRTAKDNRAFVFVGPEAPLGLGIANAASEEGLEVFGPTQEAARLETSKSWAIDFMMRHNIPHPRSVVISDPHVAIHFFDEPVSNDVVVKADGLAAGKGVFLPSSKEEALNAVRRIMINKEFDDGSKIIIQERLRGKEISLIVFTDGKTIVPLLPAKDYKRANDNDKGPNTGGMGAFAPAPMSAKLYREVYNTVLRPTVDGMREEGNLFRGSLYVGLMLTEHGPKVLEFNVRLGDPETQPLMMLLESDLLRSFKNTARGELKRSDIYFRKGASVCVVLSAEGYPGKPKTGDEVSGLDNGGTDVQIIHGATILKNGKVETNGGRVVNIVAYGKNRLDARRRANSYIGKEGVHFKGMHYRKDIGT